MPDDGVFHVVAVCQSRPGLERAVLDLLEPLVPDALEEAGCLKYTLHVDHEDHGRFVFIETWADRAALDAHLATPVSKALAENLTPLLAYPAIISRLQQIG